MSDTSYYGAPAGDLDAQDQAAALAPPNQAARLGETYGHFDFTRSALQFGKHLVLDTLGVDPADPVSEGDSFGDRDTRMTSDQANARYGIDGVLRFNQPVTDQDAAWQSAMAHERMYRDIVLSTTRPTPLTDIGSSLAGAMTDPLGLGLMTATGGLGEAAFGAVGLGRAAEAGAVVSRLGRVANLAAGAGRTLGEGAIDNVPYVAANAGLTNYAGDDYGYGDALRDIAAGAILHTGVHYFGEGLRAGHAALADRIAQAHAEPAIPLDVAGTPDATAPDLRALYPDPAPIEGVPDAVQALGPTARVGAFAKAVDDMAADRPVDVGRYVQRELDSANAPPEGAPDAGEPTPGRFGDVRDYWAALRAETPPAEPEPLGEVAPQAEQAEDQPHVASSRQILQQVARQYASGDTGDLDTVRAPGTSDPGAEPRNPQVVDLRSDLHEAGTVDAGARGNRGASGDGNARAAGDPGSGHLHAEREVGSDGVGDGDAVRAAKPSRAESLIAADPELRALQQDTERLAAENGIAPPADDPKSNPRTLADAIHAAAICLAEEVA